MVLGRAKRPPQPMAKQRTVDARTHQAGRFRPEAVTNARRRPVATIGELMLYKQLQRAERGRRRSGED